MTDRELLGLAAKAGCIRIRKWNVELIPEGECRGGWQQDGRNTYWSPLTDDGDALRLAVKCGIDIFTNDGGAGEVGARITNDLPWVVLPISGDKGAATRRAIVRAAAEIGRAT